MGSFALRMSLNGVLSIVKISQHSKRSAGITRILIWSLNVLGRIFSACQWDLVLGSFIQAVFRFVHLVAVLGSLCSAGTGNSPKGKLQRSKFETWSLKARSMKNFLLQDTGSATT